MRGGWLLIWNKVKTHNSSYRSSLVVVGKLDRGGERSQ
jgi:hypothetical protein